jgi:hypothetical protein
MSAKTELQINFKGVDKTAGVIRGMNASITRFATTAMASLAGVFAFTKVISGTTNLIKRLDEIGDTSSKIGLSAEGYQKLGFAFGQLGLNSEDAGKHISMMKKNIAIKGDIDGNIFERMGMSVQELKNQKPEEQFYTIGKAIANLGNESDRVQSLTEIFGKGGGELAGLMRAGPDAFVEGMKDVSGMISMASEESVNMGGMMADAFKAVGTSMQNDFGQAFLNIMNFGQESFGRIDVAIFSAYQSVKLFASNTLALFQYISDKAAALFYGNALDDVETLEARFEANVAKKIEAVQAFTVGVYAKDKLEESMKNGGAAADVLGSKINKVRDSIRNFGKMELAGTYATIQSKFGGMMPAVGGGMRGEKGNVGGFGVMENLLKKIADNTSDTADQLEGLDEI